ncbi:MAG: hypothetical protein PHP64_05095 [Actinomycetota bacterium]|nr:hypothetical protein [Actinomycetota bacterium]
MSDVWKIYRRIRKPIPPPERIESSKKRKLKKKIDEQEIGKYQDWKRSDVNKGNEK